VSAEVEVWKHRDPSQRLRRWLSTSGRAGAEFFEAVDAEADELGASVRERCLAMPDPDGSEMFDQVYAEAHPVTERERAWFDEYHASFEGAS
jgi:2-oxoisovalerate dehydrogenase E1 component alpha subunit